MDPNDYHAILIENFLLTQCDLLRLHYRKNPKKLIEGPDVNYAVIVEPRSNHKLLEAVCRNVMYFLPANWNLIVYSWNESKVRERLTDMDFLFFKTPKDNLNAKEYSQLLMTESFWNTIPSEEILIFQTDSYMTRHLDSTFLNEIRLYPFVGALYRIIKSSEEIDIISIDPKRNFSMSGGFSFRRKEAMLNCLDTISIDMIKEYRINNGLPYDFSNIDYEDFYFENALFLLNYTLPSYDICVKFCSQTLYELENSYAIHGLYRNYVTQGIIYHLRPPLFETYGEINSEIIK
jgi:hypothetical protein